MSESVSFLNTETNHQIIKTNQKIAKICVLEALAKPAQGNIAPSMTWQSVWTSKEDK